MSKSIHVAGIDGCENGWLAVSIAHGASAIFQTETFPELMEHLPESDVILVDMPIGLVKNREEESYRPEKYARSFIPKKGSSIFNAPSEQAAYCTTYQDANMMNRRILGKGLSKQSYYISRKIREVDTYIKQASAQANILMESHPEVCFARLQPHKEPVLENKKSPAGQDKRLEILRSYRPDVARMVKHELSASKVLRGMVDDVIDAACLAIVAEYGMMRGFHSIPDVPRKNGDGIPMQMVYYEC